MKVLVIGRGGREHALVRAIMRSDLVTDVHAWPGSDAISREALCYRWVSNTDDLLKEVSKQNIQLVVIGPEASLVEGLADQIRAEGIDVFGPSQAGAQLEGSKILSKEFMKRWDIPTAPAEVVASVAEVKEYLKQFTPPYVLKADGLAAGKGVSLCSTEEELLERAKDYFEKKVFGEAGAKALLEQFQEGWELSVLILTNGENYIPLPLSQDHKKLNEGGKGPNTGGMGVVGPIKVSEKLKTQIHEEILKPSVEGLMRQNLDYRGVLYVGLMITNEGPKVIEYNVRFGDPEAQVLLPLLHGDWVDVFQSIARGKLPEELEWKNLYVACVVMAAANYPESPVSGTPIVGDVFFETASSYFLHGGTKKMEDGGWVTQGGRVLNALAIGSDMKEAIEKSYKQSHQVKWAGVQMRSDIGSNK